MVRHRWLDWRNRFFSAYLKWYTIHGLSEASAGKAITKP